MMFAEPIQIVRWFHGGGLGELMHCRDAAGVEFAAKFPKDLRGENQRLILDEERRFIRHQGEFVVRYLGQVRHLDGRQGFAMELMEGSLSELVARGALAPGQALAYFAQVVRGLAEVHASAPGAFHGDVKLANVLYREGTAKLSDFGLARGGRGQTVALGVHQCGTPGYFPPERWSSPRGDVYSAGVLLWALLAGREPDQVHGPVVSLSLRPALSSLLSGMLEPVPARRLSIAQVLERLPSAQQEYGVSGQDEGSGLGWLLGAGAVVFGLWALSKAKA